MKVVAVYNMKGGVGKTTTTVNLSFLAAASGRRALIWDLDPQGASSFAFRIKPSVEGFGRKALESSDMLSAAVKQTDFDNLDLLPADFAYRKFDRLLDQAGGADRLVPELIDAIGSDYDIVFLDCPAGFSLLIEGVFARADVVLVPTIPTVLSLRTVARLITWAERADSSFELAAFFNMVDRRRTLHRRACEWSSDRHDVIMATHVPYASIVEQMSARRMPLHAFAARDAAAAAFSSVWTELQPRLARAGERRPGASPWSYRLRAIESLMARLEDPPLPSGVGEVSDVNPDRALRPDTHREV